jgi:hypothetical protein
MRRRHAIVIACVIGSAGCLDREGLDPGGPGLDGGTDAPGGGKGGSGTGGSGGQMGGKGGSGTGGGGGQMGGSGGQMGGRGGQMGGAGGSGGTGGQMGGTGGKSDGGVDVPPMCGPVCAIFCPNGNVLDERGCPTCRCNPPPMCPAVACDLFCRYGYQKDDKGCEVCKCNPPPMCTPVTCKLFCPHGFKKDAQGCEICACNDPPSTCSPQECGPAPGAPNHMCADGTVAGPVCERTSTGRCAWVFRECPDGCGDARTLTACLAMPACRWLEPGCTEPKLAVAGCYPRALIGCDQKACPDGRECVKRVINPCGSPDSAGAPAPLPGLVPPPIGGCAACGQTIAICL